MKLSGPENYYSWTMITKVTLINKDVWDIVNRERRRLFSILNLVK